MDDILKRLFEILGPEYRVGKLLGVIATIVTITLGGLAAYRYVYSHAKNLLLLRLRRWKVRQLDDLAKQLLAGERAYLSCFLGLIRSRKWDPQHFVRPHFRVSQKISEPIDPILLLLDRVSGLGSKESTDTSEFKQRIKINRVKDLLTLLSEVKNLVILGDPGSGKTTCLLQLGIELANRAVLSHTLYPILPIFIPLNEFTDPLPATKTSEAVLNFITQQIQQQTAALEGADISKRLDILIRDGRLVFLFDALDEMPRDGYYDRFRALSRFQKSCLALNENNVFVFTCRRLDYIDDPTFRVQQAIISPFSDRQIRQFFNRYLLDAGSSAYSNFISKDADLVLQARTPFFLTLFTTCVHADAEPGGTWDVLIANFVEVVFDEYRKTHGFDKTEWDPTAIELIAWLSDLAFELVRNRATGTKADPEMIAASLQRTGVSPENVDIACECGIIRKVGSKGAIRYEHHRLQEYFAALTMASFLDEGQIDVYDYLDDIWWREVIVMASGLMKHPDTLIGQILDAAENIQFSQFSEVRLEFSRVMTAMSCYRPASHNLKHNTRERLTEYLIQFLRHGNILQKVKALRVVPQFNHRRVLTEAKSLLHDKSKWVRETALLAVAESTTMGSGLGNTVRHQMFQMLRAENLLIQGLQDFPALFKHRKTRVFVPLYFACIILGGLKAGAAWLMLLGYLVFLYLKNLMSFETVIWYVMLVPASYFIAKRLLRRRLVHGYRLNMTDSFNRWTVLTVVLVGTLQLVTAGLDSIAERSGSITNLGVRIAYILLLWLILYLYSRNILRLYVVLRDRRRKRWVDPSTIIPEKMMRGRCEQAQTLLVAARKEPDPTQRENLIEAIKTLLPLNRSILLALEDYSEGELDINVRTKAFQVYEQVELSIEREERGKGLASSATL